jgi:hypothetical protein
LLCNGKKVVHGLTSSIGISAACRIFYNKKQGLVISVRDRKSKKAECLIANTATSNE